MCAFSGMFIWIRNISLKEDADLYHSYYWYAQRIGMNKIDIMNCQFYLYQDSCIPSIGEYLQYLGGNNLGNKGKIYFQK